MLSLRNRSYSCPKPGRIPRTTPSKPTQYSAVLALVQLWYCSSISEFLSWAVRQTCCVIYALQHSYPTLHTSSCTLPTNEGSPALCCQQWHLSFRGSSRRASFDPIAWPSVTSSTCSSMGQSCWDHHCHPWRSYSQFVAWGRGTHRNWRGRLSSDQACPRTRGLHLRHVTDCPW